MALTDPKAREAKPKDKPYKIYDSQGLYILVRPSGVKCWRWKYKIWDIEKQKDVEKVLALGIYGKGIEQLSIKAAREKRREAEDLLKRGIDPNEEKKPKRPTLDNSFGIIAQEWKEKQLVSWAPATNKKNTSMLNNDILPYIRNRNIADIETYELLGLLNRVVDRGAIDSAHKCRQIINQICRYAKQTGRAKHNPASDLTGALPNRKAIHRPAIIDPPQFAKLLVDIDAYSGSQIIRTMLALAPLLFQRPIELAAMEWSELDMQNHYWHIPLIKKKERNKSEGDHLVPLPSQAMALLNDIRPLTGEGIYVFPNQRRTDSHASPETVNKALRTMGYDTGKVQCFHGFRASARTMMDEQLGLRPEWIEHQLAHKVKDALGNAYNRTKHLPERIDMMQRWGNYLDDLKRQAIAGKVITTDFGRKNERRNY